MPKATPIFQSEQHPAGSIDSYPGVVSEPLTENKDTSASPDQLKCRSDPSFSRRGLLLGASAGLTLVTVRDAKAARLPSKDGEAILSAARDAFGRYQLAACRRQLELAAELPLDQAAVAARALRTLAEYDWKFGRDATAAEGRLAKALLLSDGAPETLVQRARLFRATGRPAAALRDVRTVVASNIDENERLDALVVYGQLAADAVRSQPLAPDIRGRSAEAADRLRDVLSVLPGRSDAAEALIAIGAATLDLTAVLDGLAAYNFIADPRSATGIMKEPIVSILNLRATRDAQPTIHSQRQLAIALAKSRFYADAARVTRPVAAGVADLEGYVAYATFLERIERVNAAFYPRVANGMRDYETAYDAAMAAQVRIFSTDLGLPGPSVGQTPKMIVDGVLSSIAERFGVEGYVGETVGFYGLLAGHTVIDERRTIEQHGRSSDLRYVSLDRMISRDFTSWYGATNVGGWGTSSTIFQVRQAYLVAPYDQLSWLTDQRALAAIEQRIATLEIDDLRRCRADPFAAPEAVAIRIRLAASRRIWDRLEGRGPEPSRRATAFIAEVLKLTTEATVFGHEGRHAIDQAHRAKAFAAMDDAERELRAKYAEVGCSQDPRYALAGSIFGARLDERGGHGKANRLFREALVRWMDRHRSEIRGLATERPLVMQVDLLSDGQLRAFIESVDRF